MALNFPFKKSSSDSSDLPDKSDEDNDFYEAINLFNSQRKKAGISLEQLSKETKISRNVLIAIENGWKNDLPEQTYLISMIKSLEIKLNIRRGGLNGLLTQNSSKNISRLKLNFINIDFLNNWIGSVLYIIFMLLSILLLNSQQRYLIKINSVSNEPIITEKPVNKDKNLIKIRKAK